MIVGDFLWNEIIMNEIFNKTSIFWSSAPCRLNCSNDFSRPKRKIWHIHFASKSHLRASSPPRSLEKINMNDTKLIGHNINVDKWFNVQRKQHQIFFSKTCNAFRIIYMYDMFNINLPFLITKKSYSAVTLQRMALTYA